MTKRIPITSTRKVVKHGATSMISLPKKWCKEQGIQNSDELICHTQRKKITYFLRSADHLYETSKSIDLRHASPTFTKKILYDLHKTGYDKINITINSQKQADFIINHVHSELINFNVSNHTDRSLTIEKIYVYGPEDFPTILTKVLQSAQVVVDQFQVVLKQTDEKEINLLLSLEKNNNRLTNFGERLLSKYTNVTEGATFLYVIVWNAETLCDSIRDMARLMGLSGIRPHKTIVREFAHLALQYKAWKGQFSHFDYKAMDRLTQENAASNKRLFDLLSETKDTSLLLYLPSLITINKDISAFFGSTACYHALKSE